jgi:hypothetical protein
MGEGGKKAHERPPGELDRCSEVSEALRFGIVDGSQDNGIRGLLHGHAVRFVQGWNVRNVSQMTKLISYRCDYCDVELEKPALTLSSETEESHFCSQVCLIKHLSKQATYANRRSLVDLLEEWEKFGGALRSDDREKFTQMLREAEPLAHALLSSDQEVQPSEALLMASLLVLRGKKAKETASNRQGELG